MSMGCECARYGNIDSKDEGKLQMRGCLCLAKRD
jgi:hypothetical protein